MCGIIAVVPRPSGRTAPAVDLLARLEDALSNALEAEAGDPTSRLDALRRSCEQLEAVDAHLRGSVGLRWMLDDVDRLEALDRRAGEFEAWVAKIEDRMDAEAAEELADTAEQTNQALVRLKDGLWRICRDRIAGTWAVATLAGADREGATLEAFAAIQTALSALDRLDVRGRDSAGLHVLVSGHGLELDDPEVATMLARRGSDPLFRSRSVRVPGSCLSFVYKTANETAGDHWEPLGSDGIWTKRGPRLARRQGGPVLPGRGRLRRFGPPRLGTDLGPDRLAGRGKADHGLGRRSPVCKARSGWIATCGASERRRSRPSWCCRWLSAQDQSCLL